MHFARREGRSPPGLGRFARKTMVVTGVGDQSQNWPIDLVIFGEAAFATGSDDQLYNPGQGEQEQYALEEVF